MTDYDNTNRGAIWKNDRKEQETHPDFKGSLNVEGKDYWVSAWKKKEGANPQSPALSFSIQLKEEKAKPANASNTAEAQDDFDDDIPFN